MNPIHTVRDRVVFSFALIAISLSVAACSTSTLTSASPTPVKCQVTVGSAPGPLGAGGGTAVVKVSAAPECAWTARADANWIASLNPDSGQGSADVSVAVAPNSAPSTRQASVTINDAKVAITQEPAVCTFEVTAPGQVDVNGGALTVSVNTAAGCAWTAASSTSWLAAPQNAGGTGPGTATFTAAPNPGSSRSGTVTVAGKQITIEQRGSSGCFNITPLSATVAAAGGQVTMTIDAAGACPWTVLPAVPWISASPASGSGTANVTLTLAANGGAQRSGTVAVGDAVVTITQTAAACSYVLTPDSYSSPSRGDASSIRVTTPSSCSWTARATESWVTLTGDTGGNGNGTIAFSTARNDGGPRSAAIQIADQIFAINQAGGEAAACAYSLSASSQNVPATAGAASPVTVTASGGCGWTAGSNASWITITSGANGNGNGTVAFSVAANSGGERSGTLTIAGQTYTVTQAAAAAASCSYLLSATSASAASGGGAGTPFSVNTTASCGWTAVSDVGWITVTSGAKGTGTGSVAYTVAANSGGARSGTITVEGQKFTVNQAAAASSCSFSIAPTSLSASSQGGTGISVNVTTTASCPWTAASNNEWLKIATGTSGLGAGSVVFGVDPNTGPARSGTLTIAGQTYTVNQASGCTYSINPTSKSFPKNGGSDTVAVTTAAGCTWSAQSNVGWIDITSGASGNGSGTVAYKVDSNGKKDRSGTLTVAGQTFTVNQSN
jgi:hypothetical protein